jgi:pyruvate,water dikinase
MSATALSPTITLDQLDRDDLPIVGGKAANLGALLHAGLPVPPGFCVTADAYRSVVQPLSAWIDQRVADLDIEDTAALDRVAREIRQAIEAAAIPEPLADALRAAYQSLGAPPVAVRSSATAEDLPDSSFAGQQDTFLNIRGDDALFDAVRRCWSSLWTPRAIAYRQRNGFDHAAVALAVVVQQMIEAEVAGVLFTADPVSGDRTRMIVNGAWGLGEAVVSGLVSPDGWTLDQRGDVIEHELGSKERMIVYSAAGGAVEQPTPPELRARPCLTLAQLRQLHELGRAAQEHFGGPQDIEWAFRAGRCYLVQSRPITTLFPLPEPRPSDGEYHVYFSFNALQGIVEPLTPLGIDIFRELARTVQAATGLPVFPRNGSPRLTQAAARIYIDATAMLRHPIGRRLIQIPFRVIDPMTAQFFPQLLSDPRLAVRPAARRRIGRAVVGFLWRIRPLLKRAVFSIARPELARQQADAAIRQRMERLDQLVARPMTLAERRQVVRVVIMSAGSIVVPYFPPMIAPALLSFYLTDLLARRWGLPSRTVIAVRQAVRGNPTTEMDLALWRLSQTIKADPEAQRRFASSSDAELSAAYVAGRLPPAAQRGLHDFLAQYGHRAVREIDVGMPRWSETPGYMINTIRNYLLLDDPALAADQRFAALEQAAETARAELLHLARQQRAGWLKAAVLRFLTGRMRRLLGVREAPKFWAVRMLALIRRVLQGAGEELTRSGALDAANDIFFLKLDEIERAAAGQTADLRQRVAERRAEYQRELQRQRWPRVLTSAGELRAARRAAGGSNELSGQGVSPGVYQGRVRIVRDPHGARLEPGEILVAPSTDPAWTPLFLTAGGLIMEAGGMLSHGSVVAREYGLPAIVGVEGATTRLTSGALVTIDGTLGTIQLVEQPAVAEVVG